MNQLLTELAWLVLLICIESELIVISAYAQERLQALLVVVVISCGTFISFLTIGWLIFHVIPLFIM